MALPRNELAEVRQNSGDWVSPDKDISSSVDHRSPERRILAFLLFTLIVVVSFSPPLYALVNFAVRSDLYSHIILLPFLSSYLVWLKRHKLVFDSRACPKLAIIPFFIGLAILASCYFARNSAWRLFPENYLAPMTLAWLAFVWCGCFLFFGLATLRIVACPLLLLLFAAPFPTYILQPLQAFLQAGSASAASLFFQLSGTPVLQQGMVFQLPGFSLEVARECSGIHSSLVLFIVSLPAAHLLLRNPWTKALLVLFVVPLAIIRNGIRIFTIAQLCIHISPDMIHSYIHRHGGPIFFLLSLIPFFLLLLLLMRFEPKA